MRSKGKTISRAPATPRQIRDIKPARQLPRSDQSQQDGDDDWWYLSNNGNATREPSAAAAQLQRVAAVNGARHRYGRRAMGSDAAAGEEGMHPDGHDECNHGNPQGIRGRIKHTFKFLVCDMVCGKFKAMSFRKKIKCLIASMILFFAWKTIYFADLDTYSTPKWESKFFSSKSNSSPSVTGVKSMDTYLSSLATGKDSYGSTSGVRSSTNNEGSTLGQTLRQREMNLDAGISSKTAYQVNSVGVPGLIGQTMLSGQAGSQNYQIANKPQMNMIGQSGQYNPMLNTGSSNVKNTPTDDWFDDSLSKDSSVNKISSIGQAGMPQSQQNRQSSYSSLQQQPNMPNGSLTQAANSQSRLSWSNPQAQTQNNYQPLQSSFQQQANMPNSNSLHAGIPQPKQTWSIPQTQQQHNYQPLQSSFQQQPNMLNGNSLHAGIPQQQKNNYQPLQSSFQQQPNIPNVQSGIPQPKNSWPDSQSQQQNHQPINALFQQQPNMSNGNNLQSNFISPNSIENKRMPMPNSQSQPLNQYNAHSPNGQQLPNQHSAQQQQYQGLRGQSNPLTNQLQQSGNSWESQYSNSQNALLGPDKIRNDQRLKTHRPHAELNCVLHGGPYTSVDVSELVYWRDIPTDASFASDLFAGSNDASTPYQNIKYITFEMDDSGWNNARMGLENMMILAHAMGRTLVIPPKRQIAHMVDKSAGRVFSFDDFYDFSVINAEQAGLSIITMEQFLEREALNSNLKSVMDGDLIYPPNNQTKWDNERLSPLWDYIRGVSKSFEWKPFECILAFPARGNNISTMASLMNDLLVGKDGRPFPHYSEFQGKPTRVDAPPIERLREILAGRRKICMYDEIEHADTNVVHFKADENDGKRLIIEFYAFLWFEDWKYDLWSKRFIRDHLRYKDEIMCLAARVVNTIRSHVKNRSPENSQGLYDAVHIRRGDFQTQFPITEMSANEIVSELQDYIVPNSTLFICTDAFENMSFFEPIEKIYDVHYLHDFTETLFDVNPNFFGLVEQVVASRSRFFFGTYYSTFSSFVVRLRGYFSVKEMQDGYKAGVLRNTFYLPRKFKKEMHLYQAVHQPFYSRVSPVAWRDIDKK